jgi:hypothetical protein
MPKLEMLVLSVNLVKDLEPIVACKNLIQINLSQNRLKSY